MIPARAREGPYIQGDPQLGIRVKPHVNLEITIPGVRDRDQLCNWIGWLVEERLGTEFHIYGLPTDNEPIRPLALFLNYLGPTARGPSKRTIAEVKAFIRGALAMWETCNKNGI
jgi:hypothetical protein